MSTTAPFGSVNLGYLSRIDSFSKIRLHYNNDTTVTIGGKLRFFDGFLRLFVGYKVTVKCAGIDYTDTYPNIHPETRLGWSQNEAIHLLAARVKEFGLPPFSGQKLKFETSPGMIRREAQVPYWVKDGTSFYLSLLSLKSAERLDHATRYGFLVTMHWPVYHAEVTK